MLGVDISRHRRIWDAMERRVERLNQFIEEFKDRVS
jgi:hypothetical protein